MGFKEMDNKQHDFKILVYIFICSIVALVFQILPIKNILMGVYKWHLSQPETIQGGLELIIVFIIACVISIYIDNNKFKLMGLIVLVSIYLRLHQVLIPGIVAVIYFEMIISIGKFVYKVININNTTKKYINYFIIGISLWACIAIFISLIGHGTFNEIRIMTLILWIVSISKGFGKPLSYKLIERLNEFDNKQKIGVLFIFILLLAQLAKSNRGIDFDSIWYGLRPEQVLIGDKSFLDNLGLVQVVHYYPKLFELFLIPISNLGDYSFIYAGNTFILGLLAYEIYLFARDMKWNRTNSIFISCILVSIPSVCNMASTAKSDLFTNLLIIITVHYLGNYIINKDFDELCIGVSAGILSYGAKMTSFLYTSLAIVSFLLIFSISKFINSKNKKSNDKNKKVEIHNKHKSLFVVVSSFLALTGITYRTYKLTGYPIANKLISFWNKLGFSAQYPFSDIENIRARSTPVSIFDILHKWYNALFNPADYSHYVMVWPSNLAIYIFIIALITFIILKPKYKLIHLIYMAMGLLIMLSGIYYITMLPSAGDGNYYIVPTILSILLISNFININFQSKSKFFSLIILIFIAINSTIMFVSHWSWQWGTDKFNINLLKSPFESIERNENEFRQEGLFEINNYIKEGNENARCIGFGDTQLLNKLPCRFEDIPCMIEPFGNPNIFPTKKDFFKYLKWAKIDYLIRPKSGIVNYSVVKSAYDMIENNNEVITVESKNYYLFDISGIKSFDDVRKKNKVFGQGWYEASENTWGWIADTAEIVLKSEEKGKVTINGYIPDGFGENEIEVWVNDSLVIEKTLNEGKFGINFNVEKNTFLNMKIKLDKYVIPYELGLNNDKRKLGVLIDSICIE